jgi:O-antigen ligase
MVLSLVFFFISITSIFLSEVFANYNLQELSLFLVLLSPLPLFLLAKIEKKKIFIPFKETIYYLFFLIFSVVSTTFAIDKEIAIKTLLTYVSGYLFFVFSFNYSDNLDKNFKKFLIAISIFSCFIFFLNSVFNLNLFWKGVSLFYNYGHYQIGNLLVLGLIPIFPNPLSLLFFLFILFSYSRTAHISLAVIIIFQLLKSKFDKRAVLIGMSIIFLSFLFIIFKTQNQYQTKNKQLVGGRNVYFSYALSSIKELPLFGLGPGNFVYAVIKRQVNYGEFTDAAENFILEVLAENGLLAGMFFILFVLMILYRHKKNNNFLIFLALTLMFMTDFSYHFNIFLITWFVLGGLVSNSDKNNEINIIPYAVIIFIGAQIILSSQILLKQGLWKQSLLINPIQQSAYKTGISENIKYKNEQQAHYLLQRYDQNFGNSLALYHEINYYQALGEKAKNEPLYEKTLWFRSFLDINKLKQARNFYIDLHGNSKGDERMAQILRKIKKSYSEKEMNSDFYKIINDFCLKTNIGC